MIENLGVWEEVFRNKEWGKYPPIPLVRFIARNYYNTPDRSKIKVLELGAGTGANLWYLAREGFTVYAIEYSKTGIEKIKQRLRQEGLEDRLADIVQGDYFEVLDNFPDEFFDVIIDIESLYCNNFSKTRAIIEKAVNKLKPDGRFFSITFADGTMGLEGGEEIDYHMVVPKYGPLAGLGPQRYTTKEDIDKLYKHENTDIEFIHREDYYYTDKEVIKQWIISVRKI